MRLKDKVAVVTGGGRGIGRGIARGLLEAGAGVVVAPDDIDGMERELRALRDRWNAGTLEPIELSPEWRRKVDRLTRVQELADLVHSLEAVRAA